MNLRLCEKLNEKFIPNNYLKSCFTHQSAVTWAFIEKSFLSMLNGLHSSKPKQLRISIHFNGDMAIATFSNGVQKNVELTVKGIQDAIPRIENEGIKVESDFLKKEFLFTFTPSNY